MRSGMLVDAVYAVCLPHPSNCYVVPHLVKMCERRSVNGLTGKYLSIWYGLVCRGGFYRCPTRALTTVRTLCVICRSIRLWMVAMLRWCEVTMFVGEHGLEVDTQYQCSAHTSIVHECCWKRTTSICSPHCSRSRYSSHALCGSTTIADSCP